MSDAFEAHRAALVAHAYRMLGDVGRAEELVQEAWLRWRDHAGDVHHPRAWLLRVVTNLCLHDLDGARARREEPVGTRLPDVVGPERLDATERAEQVSLAFLVLLQRLSPAERAVLLLHEVFDLPHDEIAATLGRTAAGCRQLLRRARAAVDAADVRRIASVDEHRRLVDAFAAASWSGDLDALIDLLAPDAVLVVDAPDGAEFGGTRNLPRPLEGRERVAAFVAAVTPRGTAGGEAAGRVLNGRPALVFRRDGRDVAAVVLHVVDGRVRAVFVHADPRRVEKLIGRG